MTNPTHTTVLGRGEAAAPLMELFDARTRNTVRFADAAAWIVASATAHAVKDCKELGDLRDAIGIVTVSSEGPQGAMAEVEEGGKEGFSSPLRYAASSPGSLAGVSCIAFGFRGPTLNVTMPLPEGIPVAAFMCSVWLSSQAAKMMVLATLKKTASGEKLGRALLLSPERNGGPGDLLDAQALAWLEGKEPPGGGRA